MVEDHHDAKRRAWHNWGLIFAPLLIGGMIANRAYGFLPVFASMIALLGLVLLFQRYVGHRSWHDIIWGDQPSEQ